MSLEPHFDEESLQRASDKQANRFPNSLEYPAPIDDTDLGGNPGDPTPASLPDGKSKDFYIEGGKMLVDENIARRQIRANKARSDAGLPPIDLS